MLLSPSMPNPCHISEFTSSQSSSYTASGRKRKLLAAHPAHHVAPIIAASLSSPASMTAPCPLPMTPAERTTQMEKHFLNTLFMSLNRYRADPILSSPSLHLSAGKHTESTQLPILLFRVYIIHSIRPPMSLHSTFLSDSGYFEFTHRCYKAVAKLGAR